MMSGVRKKNGFTLIELIVVLAVMGTVLFITLPKFRIFNFGSSSEKGINILLNTVKELKKKAVFDGIDYILNIDIVKSVIWFSSNEEGKENKTNLPDSIYIKDIEIYGLPSLDTKEEYKIRFSSKGYCDMAIIHIKEREKGEDISMVIEPFLYNPEIKKKYISFEQCR